MRSLAIAWVIWMGLSQPNWATEITIAGITFSDELGGFELVGVTGQGTINDPFVVTEKVTGPMDPTLKISGLYYDKGNRLSTHHAAGLAIRKIAINATSKTWHNYEMELRKVITRHSPYEDGLSFGQNSSLGISFISSNFPFSHKTDEPQDTLSFSGTDILPGQQAIFNFIVTDMSPAVTFYLLQRPLLPVSQLSPFTPNVSGEQKNDLL